MSDLAPGGVAAIPPAQHAPLGWPIFSAFRRRYCQSLRWRLAVSHLATVFLSVLGISLVGAIAMLGATLVQDPVHREPALEAQLVAKLLEDLDWIAELDSPQASLLLQAIATGKVGPNAFDENVNLQADVGKRFANIRTVSVVSVVGQDQVTVASSDPSLIGRNPILIGPAALGVARVALEGSTSTARNSIMQRPGKSLITGAYPIRDDAGQVVGAVVVDKKQRTLASGPALPFLAMSYVGQIAFTILVLVGIPGIPIGTIAGIRRARAISRPVTELAVVAESFAKGDLSRRVEVEGSDEIAALQRSFNEMADRLQAAIAQEAAERAKVEALLAANRDLVANVSHELRTPVALVRGHLEALATEPERRDECARIALRETDRLENLVNDLFQLARVENQGIVLDREPFDAGSAAREAVESLAEPARREAGIMMGADVEPGDVRCVGDRSRLVQVLQNLIRNAIRYTPEGGMILVGVRGEGDEVAVTVRDTGVGIAPEDVPHVFERFYRGDRSRNRAGGGAGLGLAIAHEFIEGMGGTISVESVVDEGSVFTIRLPRAAATTNGDAKPAPLAAAFVTGPA